MINEIIAAININKTISNLNITANNKIRIGIIFKLNKKYFFAILTSSFVLLAIKFPIKNPEKHNNAVIKFNIFYSTIFSIIEA